MSDAIEQALAKAGNESTPLPFRCAAAHDALYKATATLQYENRGIPYFRNVQRTIVSLYGLVCVELANHNESYNHSHVVRRIKQAEAFIKHRKVTGMTITAAQEWSRKDVQKEMTDEADHDSNVKRLSNLKDMLYQDIDFIRSLCTDVRSLETRQ